MGFLKLNVDFERLNDIAEQFALTEKQFSHSLRRAIERTAGSVRKQISKNKLGIDDLRRTSAIRRRVKGLFRVKVDVRTGGIWIGLNSLWASEFKGTPRQDATGVRFRSRHYKGAFLRRLKGSRKNRIFRNENDSLEEVTIGIEAEALKFLDDLLPELPDSLYDHFLKDVEFRETVRKDFARGHYNLTEYNR